MQIHVPYVELHPKTKESLRPYRDCTTFKYLGKGLSSYHDYLASLWLKAEDFIVVEQDIGIHQVMVDEFETCQAVWCTFAYPGPGGNKLTWSLGCVRFRAELQRTFPQLFHTMEFVASEGDPSFPPKDWHRLDVRLSNALRNCSVEVCVHYPMVEHYHDYTERP